MPTVVEPSSSDLVDGVSAGSSANAESATVVSPAWVVRPKEPLNSPRLEDLKLTSTVIVSPGVIFVPVAGRPEALNGAEGDLLPLTSSVVLPVFLSVTSPFSCVLTGAEPSESVLVDGVRSGSSANAESEMEVSPAWVVRLREL